MFAKEQFEFLKRKQIVIVPFSFLRKGDYNEDFSLLENFFFWKYFVLHGGDLQ